MNEYPIIDFPYKAPYPRESKGWLVIELREWKLLINNY